MVGFFMLGGHYGGGRCSWSIISGGGVFFVVFTLRPKASTSRLWEDAPENFPKSSTLASARGVKTMTVGVPAERWLPMELVKETWEWHHMKLQEQLSNLVRM